MLNKQDQLTSTSSSISYQSWSAVALKATIRVSTEGTFITVMRIVEALINICSMTSFLRNTSDETL